jgi:thymidine kinase/deoxyadenosine/deoxycytidine kinase
MSTPTIKRERDAGRSEGREFAPRNFFLNEFSGFVHGMFSIESRIVQMDQLNKTCLVDLFRQELDRIRPLFSQSEYGLFETAFNLFSLKHSLAPHLPATSEFLKGKGMPDRLLVEIGGPIAVSKSVLSRFLSGQIGAQEAKEEFTEEATPFLNLAYASDDYWLRTEIDFLLRNILTGLNRKYVSGRWTRDTSNWSDIFVFMEWRHRTGKVTEEEYQTYMVLVELLDTLITRPDLLVMLKPSSVDRLWQGLQKRIKDHPKEREMEKVITPQDLEIICQANEAAIEILDKKGIKVAVLEVDPVDFYENPDLRYFAVYHARERLGILRELLTRDPQKAADDIEKIFAGNREAQVVVVHGKSMFNGKTSTLNFVAEKVDVQKVLAFQPRAAIRFGQEHETHMIDRDRRMIAATTIESNRLVDIISHLDQSEITPQDYPFILIDEGMLFVNSNVQEAVATIEHLRAKGFCVIIDGIDYTFQELPFTFMHDLLAETLNNKNWHEIEMGTRCKYCGKEARGTRRLKPDGSTADFDDQAYEAGEHYEPVCCEEHGSCVDQPSDFIRQPLPTEKA